MNLRGAVRKRCGRHLDPTWQLGDPNRLILWKIVDFLLDKFALMCYISRNIFHKEIIFSGRRERIGLLVAGPPILSPNGIRI